MEMLLGIISVVLLSCILYYLIGTHKKLPSKYVYQIKRLVLKKRLDTLEDVLKEVCRKTGTEMFKGSLDPKYKRRK